MNDLASSIARYLDGVATATERAELLASLQADPHAFAQFREDLRMHLELSSVLQPDDSGAIAAVIADMRPAIPTGATSRLVRALRPRVHARGVVRKRTQVRWLTLAAAACVVLGLVLVWPPASAGTVTSLTGAVSLMRGGEAGGVAWTESVTNGAALRRGDLLTTGEHGEVAWHDADGAEIILAAGSARLAANTGGAIMLMAGVLHAQVQPRSAGSPPYRITTPSGEVQVLGTAFTLRVDEQGTRVAVEHGRVRLSRVGTQRSVEVGAGESALVTLADVEPPRLVASAESSPEATSQRAARTQAPATVFQLFQKSATQPSVLAWGEVVAEPTDPDGWCLQAVNYANNLEVYLQNAGASGTGLVTVPSEGWLAFRCRIDGDGEPLCIYSLNQTTGKGVNCIIRPTTFGSWTAVRVPWSSFQNDGSDTPGIRPGDTIHNLVITANPPTPGRTMRIDDIECGSSVEPSSAITP